MHTRTALMFALLASVLLAGTARAQLQQCRDDAGHLTITDAPCPAQGKDETPAADGAPARPEPLASQSLPARAIVLLKAPLRSAPRFTLPTNPGQFHIDTSTLLVAHQAMLIDDGIRRQARLAGR